MNRRWAWVAVLAVAAALVLAVLLLGTGGGSPERREGTVASDAASDAGAPPTPPPRREQEVVAVAAERGTGAAAGPKEWSEVRVVARVSDLGPALARDVFEGLRRARQAMDPCFRAAAQQEAKQGAGPRPEGDEFGPPVVTLQLEARPGELVVVAAPLQQLGGGTTELVDCCESILRGFRIPASAATPGARYRLQHELMF